MLEYDVTCLFTVHVDGVSNTLNNAEIRCHMFIYGICGRLVPVVCRLCSRFGFENDVIYTSINSICIVVKPHGFI